MIFSAKGAYLGDLFCLVSLFWRSFLLSELILAIFSAKVANLGPNRYSVISSDIF